MHSRAVAHHQELRCRSLIEVPIALLKVVKKNYDIFNSCHGCHEVFGHFPQNRAESSVLGSVIVRHKVSYLDGVLIMQHQFWVPNCGDGFVRQQRHSGAVGQYDAPSVWAVQAGCFHRSCTLRDSKLFWCSSDEQDR